MDLLKMIGSLLLKPFTSESRVSPDTTIMMLFTTRDIRPAEYAERFFEILTNRWPAFMPTRWQPYVKPKAVKLDPRDLSEVVEEWAAPQWLSMEAGSMPEVGGLSWHVDAYGMPDWYPRISLFLRQEFAQRSGITADDLVGLASDIYELIGCVYGGITARDEGWRPCVSASIPDVYWVNFFGPTLVDLLGAEKLASAPCHRVQQMPDGGAMLMLSATREQALSREARKRAIAVKEHLGIQYFFHPSDIVDGNRRDLPQRLPFTFDLSGMPELPAPVPVEIHDEYTPDRPGFIADVPSLVEAMRSRLGKQPVELDLSKSSLKLIDQYLMEQRQETLSPEFWGSQQLWRELAAYMGEVVRIAYGGKWVVENVEDDTTAAVVRVGPKKRQYFDPIMRVAKVMTEGVDEEQLLEIEVWDWLSSHKPLEALKDFVSE